MLKTKAIHKDKHIEFQADHDIVSSCLNHMPPVAANTQINLRSF